MYSITQDDHSTTNPAVTLYHGLLPPVLLHADEPASGVCPVWKGYGLPLPQFLPHQLAQVRTLAFGQDHQGYY